MDKELVNALQEQFNHERDNAQVYLAMGDGCENMAYDGFAKCFRKQADDEMGHAGS